MHHFATIAIATITVYLLDRDEVFRHMNDGSMVQSLMLAPLWRYFCECAD